MKQVGLTMRVDYLHEINEHRDAVDQRWYRFLTACELFPVLIPNSETSTSCIFDMNLSGFILTGGNTLAVLGGDAPERDSLETKILDYSIKHQKPVLGICRGMQMIQHYFGVDLHPVTNHVAVRHNINFNENHFKVNSYHTYAAFDTTESLLIEAKSDDGAIEAISHSYLPIKGIMWHPERDEPFSESDIHIFKSHFHS